MRILALITARGGSKRLPGKNVRSLGGRPLIVWSIDVAKGIPEICDILVSTDNSEIVKIARKAGALVPWLRPAELATDTASSVDVCVHALDWYEAERGAVDGLLLLQPTSPFRTVETLLRGIELFESKDLKPVVGVSPVDSHSHPMWCFRLEEGHLSPFMSENGLNMRSQDLPRAYVVNGCFYLVKPCDLRVRHTFFGENAVPLLVESQREALDIDTEWDWWIAEKILTQ